MRWEYILGDRRKELKKKKNKDKLNNKKKKKAAKKILKSFGLSGLPSSDVIEELYCVEWKIRNGLELCIEDILRKKEINFN